MQHKGKPRTNQSRDMLHKETNKAHKTDVVNMETKQEKETKSGKLSKVEAWPQGPTELQRLPEDLLGFPIPDSAINFDTALRPATVPNSTSLLRSGEHS